MQPGFDARGRQRRADELGELSREHGIAALSPGGGIDTEGEDALLREWNRVGAQAAALS